MNRKTKFAAAVALALVGADTASSATAHLRADTGAAIADFHAISPLSVTNEDIVGRIFTGLRRGETVNVDDHRGACALGLLALADRVDGLADDGIDGCRAWRLRLG